jgi:hypothetical protein
MIVSLDMRFEVILVWYEQDNDEPVADHGQLYIRHPTETEATTIRLQINKPMDMDGDATAVGLACSDPVISRHLAFCDQGTLRIACW